MLPSPDQNLKIGSVDRFFYIFFLRTVRELSFPIFFLKFLNGENSGGMQSKRIYKCFFRPLNTNFSKFFAQIWHFQKKKKKKKTTLFFRILRSVGRGQHNNFFGGPNLTVLLQDLEKMLLWNLQGFGPWGLPPGPLWGPHVSFEQLWIPYS